MARATINEIEAAILNVNPEWITQPAEEADPGDEPCVTVYAGSTANGVVAYDLFTNANALEIRVDGFLEKKIRSIQDASKVANEVVAFIEAYEILWEKSKSE